MADEIVFKCEDSMWQMLAAEGVTGVLAKPFDMRRYDTSDNRIYRLAWGVSRRIHGVVAYGQPREGRIERSPDKTLTDVTLWEPEVEAVSFRNKATNEVLTRRYLGMEFTDWAPGWCFLLVGERVNRP